jgi:hypothetical protein
VLTWLTSRFMTFHSRNWFFNRSKTAAIVRYFCNKSLIRLEICNNNLLASSLYPLSSKHNFHVHSSNTFSLQSVYFCTSSHSKFRMVFHYFLSFEIIDTFFTNAEI